MKILKKSSIICKSILKIQQTLIESYKFNNIVRNPFRMFSDIRIKSSSIRILDIGKNYFKFTNPRKRKYLLTLLESYYNQLEKKNLSKQIFEKSLDFYYLGESDLNCINKEKIANKEFLNNLLCITIFERLSNSMSRVDYTDYHSMITELNNIPKDKRNKSKYVFTSHPTQPNSLLQIKLISEISKALEENDLEYLNYAISEFIDSVYNRKFTKPSYIDESDVYHSMAIPNILNAFCMAYELGFKDPQDFFEIPGTWITFDFDNHPEMNVGIMSHTHALCLSLTCNEYLKILNEAQILEISEIQEVASILNKVISYSKKLALLSDKLRSKSINKIEFLTNIPIINVYGMEKQIIDLLNNVVSNQNNTKAVYTSKKLLKLLEIFRFTTVAGQVRLAGEDLSDKIKDIIYDIMKEVSILNNNSLAIDMLIIANYQNINQFNLIQNIINEYNIKNIEVVPLLETFSAINDSKSNITMIASSDTRQRDGIFLTELRTLSEYVNNPQKAIYMGQGITAERGGGPFSLLHKKYISLTNSQRTRHIRTIQGFYFVCEYASKDLIFINILNGTKYINMGDGFEPNTEYMDFLFNLDQTVGVPCREMQKTTDFNNLYVENKYIKTLVDLYDYAGSRELGKKLVNVKSTRAIVQAYINSDRCSYTHPELAFWGNLSSSQIGILTKYYYENNKHFNYIISNLSFLLKRMDLNFGIEAIKLDGNNKCLNEYIKGYNSLYKILEHIGMGINSTPTLEIYKQHLGLSKDCGQEELNQKEKAFRNIFILQKNQLDCLLNKNTEDARENIKIIQTILSNFSQFNGKG